MLNISIFVVKQDHLSWDFTKYSIFFFVFIFWPISLIHLKLINIICRFFKIKTYKKWGIFKQS